MAKNDQECNPFIKTLHHEALKLFELALDNVFKELGPIADSVKVIIKETIPKIKKKWKQFGITTIKSSRTCLMLLTNRPFT